MTNSKIILWGPLNGNFFFLILLKRKDIMFVGKNKTNQNISKKNFS